ncbi:MAG: DUF6049 family protein [Actinomycetota bacterium]|nr:DUF6049 family protein [Actinomycetota bacterium]
MRITARRTYTHGVIPAGHRTARHGSTAALLIFLLAVAQLLLLSSLPRLAQAAPGDRPVIVIIDAVNPNVAAPGTPIEVRGLLVNSTDVPIDNLTVRLQRGPALTSRTDLADNDSDPVEVNDSSTAFVDLDQPLAGSGVIPFSYSTTPEALRLQSSGAYPLLVNVNGQAGSDPDSRVGEQVILLPYLAEPPAAPTELSWLWPLVETPERNAAGVFTGTALAASVAPGGRLDQALDALETQRGTPGSTPAAGQVTLAVDPELLEAASVLAGGDYQLIVDGLQQTSSIGRTDATIWLARLRTLAAGLPVIALPYADPDLGALISQGQRAAVERLLPDPDLADQVQEILGVAPLSTIAWPSGNDAADPAVLDTLAEHGITQVVAEDLLTFAGSDGETLEPVSTIPTQSGQITALVGDHVLSGLLQGEGSESGAPTMVQQRFLAELVVTAAEDPTRRRHLLLTPRRDFDPQTAALLMQATARQPWLGRLPAADLAAAVSQPAARTLISPPPESSAIPGSQLSALIGAMQAREDFASALTEPDADLRSLDRALARAATSNRGSDPEVGQAAVRDAVAAVGLLSQSVGIVAPANGTYSLASEDAPLVLTVFNNNPFTVEVTVALAPRGAPGVTTTNVVQVLPAQTRTTIAVPADVQRSGSFTVIASVSSPVGSALGTPVQLRVQSTVYGPVALAITFGAAALLALLFARRSVKYWQRRRRPAPSGSGPTGPDYAKQHTDGTEPAAEPELVQPRRSPV